MHESALITAGNGAIKQLTPDLLAICLCIGEIAMVIYLIVYNKHPKFSKKITYFVSFPLLSMPHLLRMN